MWISRESQVETTETPRQEVHLHCFADCYKYRQDQLIKLDISTEGPSITSKPYTVPLKYCEFGDHEMKQLEEAGIISQSMHDWAGPILVVPKKEECVDTSNNPGNSKMVNSTYGCVSTIENSIVTYKQHAK